MRKEYRELDDEDLARICHEAHLALRISLNDSATDVHFDALSQERKDLVINEVRLIRAGKTLAEIHQAWVDWMLKRGWCWAPYRNVDLKMHPDLVPFADLHVSEQAKVRQAQRIVFTHVMPDALEEIAYSDIRSRPHEPEELPVVCVAHGHLAPCAEEGRYCEYSDAAEDVSRVYADRYGQ